MFLRKIVLKMEICLTDDDQWFIHNNLTYKYYLSIPSPAWPLNSSPPVIIVEGVVLQADLKLYLFVCMLMYIHFSPFLGLSHLDEKVLINVTHVMNVWQRRKPATHLFIIMIIFSSLIRPLLSMHGTQKLDQLVKQTSEKSYLSSNSARIQTDLYFCCCDR